MFYMFTNVGGPPKTHDPKATAEAESWWCSVCRCPWTQRIPMPRATRSGQRQMDGIADSPKKVVGLG